MIIKAFNSSTLKENKKCSNVVFPQQQQYAFLWLKHTAHDPDLYMCVCDRVRPIPLTLLTGQVGAEYFPVMP